MSMSGFFLAGLIGFIAFFEIPTGALIPFSDDEVYLARGSYMLLAGSITSILCSASALYYEYTLSPYIGFQKVPEKTIPLKIVTNFKR